MVAQGLAKATTLLTRTLSMGDLQTYLILREASKMSGCEISAKDIILLQKMIWQLYFSIAALELCIDGGTSSIVLPQNWIFLISYKKFREKLLKNYTWHLIARLGPGAFETISGEVVKAILINISRSKSIEELGGLFGDAEDDNLIRGVDVSELRTAAEKIHTVAESKNQER